MTLIQLPGGSWMHSIGNALGYTSTLTAYGGNLLIDATGEKICMFGRFQHASKSSKDITKLHFRTGTIVNASTGASALDISLQDMSNSTGPPLVPDGTPDQTVTGILLSSLTSNTWYTTAALSGTRNVAIGELFGVVIEYDGAGRLGTDSFSLATYNRTKVFINGPGSLLMTGGTWAVPSFSNVPNIIFECDDGSFGTFDETTPSKTISSVAYKSDSAADEYALTFTVPVELAIDAAVLPITLSANTSNFEIVVYNDTTALATISFDANTIESTSTYEILVVFPSEITLSPGNTYYLSVKPTQATSNVTVYYIDVNAVGHMDPLTGGQDWKMANRVDGGAWSNYGSNLRRMRAGIRISKIHNSSGPFAVHNSQLILPTSVIGY